MKTDDVIDVVEDDDKDLPNYIIVDILDVMDYVIIYAREGFNEKYISFNKLIDKILDGITAINIFSQSLIFLDSFKEEIDESDLNEEESTLLIATVEPIIHHLAKQLSSIKPDKHGRLFGYHVERWLNPYTFLLSKEPIILYSIEERYYDTYVKL